MSNRFSLFTAILLLAFLTLAVAAQSDNNNPPVDGVFSCIVTGPRTTECKTSSPAPECRNNKDPRCHKLVIRWSEAEWQPGSVLREWFVTETGTSLPPRKGQVLKAAWSEGWIFVPVASCAVRAQRLKQKGGGYDDMRAPLNGGNTVIPADCRPE